MEQIVRITHMESLLDEVTAALSGLSKSLEQYERIQPALQELEAYYGSSLWRQDFADDEAGLLPSDLKRGVLSEDGIWNLLEEHRRILEEMKRIVEVKP